MGGMGSWGLREIDPTLAARYRDEGFWTDDTLGQLLSQHLAATAGDLDFRVWSDRRPVQRTVGEVFADARRFAGGLRARGIEPGDTVAFQLPNCQEAAIVFWGIAMCGAVVVPIVHFYDAREVDYILRDSGARLIVTVDRFGTLDHLDALCGLVPGLSDLETIVRVSFDEAEGATEVGDRPVVELADVLTAAPVDEAAEVGSDQPALVAYTSGTTADPKGVIHTHRSIVAEIKQLGDSQPTSEHPNLTGAPVGHAIGMLAALLLPVYRHQPIHMIDVWNPPAVLDAMVAADLSAGAGSTYFLTSLLDAPGYGPEHVERMRHIGLGGSSVPEPVADRAIGLGISIVRAYGSTEHPSISGATHDLPQAKRKATDGLPMAGVEVRIVDESGRDVPRGTAGEIWSRGPELCAGYTDPELTARAFDEAGWYHTGDIGFLDDDGWLTITDRLSDIIIRGGENVSAMEVETLLIGLPDVLEVAVVAAPDERLGEHAAAFFTVADPDGGGPDLDAVRAHLADAGLARQKWPEELHVTSELPGGQFPRTPSGKIKKHDLRAWLRARAG
jgi:acyl-CoA synthetase (AMP-forming)/AMP-acid ligase II